MFDKDTIIEALCNLAEWDATELRRIYDSFRYPPHWLKPEEAIDIIAEDILQDWDPEDIQEFLDRNL